MVTDRSYTPLILAVVLNATVWASITLSRTYVDVLFLSSYPVSFLPYFFIGQTVVVLLMTLIVTPVASQGSGFVNAAIYVIAGLSVINGDIFVRAEIPNMAFIFSLWLSALPVVLLVISQNTIADAFDVRRFKKNLTWVTMAGHLGGLVIGFLTPTIIGYFNTEMLLYVLVTLIFFAAAASYQLKPLPSPARRHSQGHSPFNYSLFRNIALCTFLMMLVDTFADYALKLELGRTFENDKEEIGKFMGPFYGISSSLMLLFQGMGTQPLLKLFGVAGLISAIPWVCGITSVGLFMMPSLWTAAALRLSENALRFSFFSIGREIALKPLPARIRRAGKFLVIAVGYVGAGVGSILLLLLGEHMSLKVLALLLVVICLLWIATALHLSRIYQYTLEEAIRIKRFNLNDEGTMVQERDNILQVATLAFQDSNRDTVRFGFTLLERAHIERVPEAAYPHLNAQDPETRVDFLGTVYRLRDENMVPMMLKRLEVEKDGKVIWWLFKTLSMLAPETVVKKAEAMLNHSDPLVRAGAVVALLTGGGLPYLIRAANALKTMLNDKDNPAMRKGAAYAISALKIGNLEEELRALLTDEDELVNIAAMWAVTDQVMYQGNINLIRALASKLGHGRVSHYASRTLKMIGAPTLPYLSEIIENAQWTGRQQSAARAAVRVLVSIRGTQADQVILQGARKGSVMTRTQLAKECAMRAKHQPNSDLLIREAHGMVLAEAENIRLLKTAQESDTLCEHSKLEIAHRKKMAQARLLYWFDVYTKSTELIGVIPVILHENTSQKVAVQHATALEFLDTLTRDTMLKQAIAVFEEKADGENIPQAVEAIRHGDDLWLERALDPPPYQSGGLMDITHKVMLLRKVRLFADLPGEILLTIAENCKNRETVKGEKLMARGDAPDGLYIIASGSICIEKEGLRLTELKGGDFFGELGLFDDTPRKADAIAITDGMVLFLKKEVFDGLTEDLPEVLRALVRTVISYVK